MADQITFEEFRPYIQQKYAAVFAAGFVLPSQVNPVLDVPVGEPLHKVVRFMAKIVVNDFGGLLILALYGYGLSGAKVARSMFEASVNAAYLASRTDRGCGLHRSPGRRSDPRSRERHIPTRRRRERPSRPRNSPWPACAAQWREEHRLGLARILSRRRTRECGSPRARSARAACGVCSRRTHPSHEPSRRRFALLPRERPIRSRRNQGTCCRLEPGGGSRRSCGPMGSSGCSVQRRLLF